MTLEDAKKLHDLQENGCRVKIYTGYADNFAEIYELDGQYVYDSSVFSKRPLSEIDIDEVEVYRHADEWDEYLDQKKFQEA